MSDQHFLYINEAVFRIKVSPSINELAFVDYYKTDIRTCPFALASEFLKKRLWGKHILVYTCPNG